METVNTAFPRKHLNVYLESISLPFFTRALIDFLLYVSPWTLTRAQQAGWHEGLQDHHRRPVRGCVPDLHAVSLCSQGWNETLGMVILRGSSW